MAKEQPNQVPKEEPKGEPGGQWTDEQRLDRVLQSQGRPVAEKSTFDSNEKKQLIELCSPSGGIVVGIRGRFEEIVARRNERLEQSKATAEDD